MKGRGLSCCEKTAGLRSSDSLLFPYRHIVRLIRASPRYTLLEFLVPTHPLPSLYNPQDCLSVPFGSTRSSLTAQPRSSGSSSEALDLLPHFTTDFPLVLYGV